MAIDIRATVTCSLGTLISGSISDDYIQGSGLVKTRGSVEISGTITPAIGTAVTFSYVKGGVTRSIPRKLRVMSSFADPFRRTTTVELGCKLTYLSDLKEPVDWTAFDDPQNAAYNEGDARIVTLPIYASSVMNKCLTELGITASSNPLTSKFSIAKFDFSAGYVSVLNDLLVSESYCGYLNTNEVLQIFALDQKAGTGPVFTASDIVDLGPIGVGSLPGEAVTVSYSTLKLKEPDPDADAESLNWERSVSSSPVSILINYGQNKSRVYTGVETTVDTTVYTTINGKEVPSKRIIRETRLNASVAGRLVQEYLENGLRFDADSVQAQTEELFFYDEEGNEIGRQRLRYQSGLETYGSVGLPMVFSSGNFVTLPNPINIYLVEKVITIFRRSANYTRTETYSYGLWNLSIPGQQAIASARDSFGLAAQVARYIELTLQGGLVLLDSSFDTRFTGSLDSQERPPAADRINSSYAKGGDPNNGWRTESKADLELAVGSATAQRRIELSMPYAPDDTFSGPSGGPFTATPSDASPKANRYGRVQNRLLLGNRSGINLQLAPEKLPAAPYSPLYVQANGLTALYRANGTNWAFDSNGIVASVDALFWAAVSGTGTFWFPVAPGITTLPAEPPIVNGEMNATNTVLPYNETAVYDAAVRTRLDILSLNYALSLLTELPVLVLKTKLTIRSVKVISIPAVAVTLLARTPQVVVGASVSVPAITVTVGASAPAVSSGATASPAVFDFSLTAYTPDFVGEAGAVMVMPESTITLVTNTPAINAGKRVSVPVSDFATVAYPAIIWREPAYFVDQSSSASTGSYSLAWPSHQTNDIGLVIVEASGDDTTLTPPSGWSALTGSPVVDVASAAGSKLQVWWRRATSSTEADVQIPDGTNHQIASLAVFRGCPTAGDPWDVLVTGTKTAASTTATVPSVTTTEFNSLVVMIVGRPDDSANTAHFGVPVNTTLHSVTKHFENGSTVGNGGGFVVASGIMANQNATGTSTLTKTASTTDTYFVVALKGI